MNEAVTRIIGAAAIDTPPFGLTPGGSRSNFIDRMHEFLSGADRRKRTNQRPYRRGRPNSKVACPPPARTGERKYGDIQYCSAGPGQPRPTSARRTVDPGPAGVWQC